MFGIALGFLKGNWKWILIGLAVASLIGGAVWKINDMKKQAYKSGVMAEHARVEKLISKENERNADFEKRLGDAITKFGNDVLKADQKRIATEIHHKTIVEEFIKNDPIYQQCKVDQRILDERNKIRALGPSKEFLDAFREVEPPQ